MISVNGGHDNVSSANQCLIIVQVIEEGSNGPCSVLISEGKTRVFLHKIGLGRLSIGLLSPHKPPTLTIALLERKSLFFVRA